MNDTTPSKRADVPASEDQGTAQAQLRHALDTALAQYQDTMGEEFPTAPKLDVVAHDAFWALAEMVGDVLTIRVSTETVTRTEELWKNALTDTDTQDSALVPLTASADDLIHLSLVWLMLHEMHHFQMGHFQIVDRAYLTETFGAHAFAVAKRAKATENRALHHVPKEDRHKVEPCLEMQADHDAIEMLLDAYSPNEWPSLRVRAAAISAMMILIEREDSGHEQEHSSHPKAATRIFQLLGHLTQMPSIEAMLADQQPELGIDPHIPDEDEIAAYTAEVLTPTFLDAKTLASAGHAASIAHDLGDQATFFKDIQTAMSGNPTTLQTSGANEWAELIKVNLLLSYA